MCVFVCVLMQIHGYPDVCMSFFIVLGFSFCLFLTFFSFSFCRVRFFLNNFPVFVYIFMLVIICIRLFNVCIVVTLFFFFCMTVVMKLKFSFFQMKEIEQQRLESERQIQDIQDRYTDQERKMQQANMHLQQRVKVCDDDFNWYFCYVDYVCIYVYIFFTIIIFDLLIYLYSFNN